MDALPTELAVLTTLSGAAFGEQQKWLQDRMEIVAEKGVAIAVFKYYDASPRMFRFGRLQSQLMPLARYPVFDKEKKIWRSQRLEEHLASGKSRSVVTKGVLDTMASSVSCHWMDRHDGDAIRGLK